MNHEKPQYLAKTALLGIALALAMLGGACGKKNAQLSPPANQQGLLPSTTDMYVVPQTTIYEDITRDGMINEVYPNTTGVLDSVYPNTTARGGVTNGDREITRAADIKRIAQRQKDVKRAAVVVTDTGDVLVAVEPKDGATRISDASIRAIEDASTGRTRVTADKGHYAEVKAMETAARGATVAADRIRGIWNTLA